MPGLAREANEPQVNELPTAERYPITIAPGQSRLFLDFCAAGPAVRSFYPWLATSTAAESGRGQRPELPAHWAELAGLIAAQNSSPAAGPALEALARGAGTVVTGQQVGIFGGPLFTPFKAATAIARARQLTAEGHPHTAIFWLASEDHDFAEINHITFPAGREPAELVYAKAPEAPRPVGSLALDETIVPLVERAIQLIGVSGAAEELAHAYRPGRTFAQAFADFYAKIFSPLGLLILDAHSRAIHRLGAPVLRAGLERADELHAALLERNRALETAGYHAQVAVAAQSSLLFLIDEKTGERLALKRIAPTAAEPDGLWQTAGQGGSRSFSTAELLGILDAEPERISPSALLRPVFQDFLLCPSLVAGGPAEIAYYAQNAVLYERILGRATPAEPRFSATLIEPAAGELLRKHDLTLEQVFADESAGSLALKLAARSMPAETKQKLAAAGSAFDAELTALVEWMQSQDKGLGQSAETAAGKMRYQMNRLRTLAANFQLQRESTLTRHANAIFNALYPGGILQERVYGAAYYFARYGLDLAETLCAQAAQCAGHTALWL